MSVENNELENALSAWFPKELDAQAMSNILCRLDEYKIGCVNVTTLDDFAGTKSLQMKIAQYMQPSTKIGVRRTTVPLLSSQIGSSEGYGDDISILTEQLSLSETRLTTPLLIWVDDNPHYNTKHVDYAQSLGVSVIELYSTAEAKLWIDENLGIPHSEPLSSKGANYRLPEIKQFRFQDTIYHRQRQTGKGTKSSSISQFQWRRSPSSLCSRTTTFGYSCIGILF